MIILFISALALITQARHRDIFPASKAARELLATGAEAATRSEFTGSMTSPKPAHPARSGLLCSGQRQQRRQTLHRDRIGASTPGTLDLPPVPALVDGAGESALF